MKAAVIQNGRLEIWDLPVPAVGEYDALCRMEYGATCAGTDLRLIAGKHPNPISYPTILGHESVGRVVEVGRRVKNFKVGQLISRVGAPAGLVSGLNASWGGFSEFGIARDHWEMAKNGEDSALWNRNRVNQVIPPEISPKEAPMIITWRETLSYILRLGVREGERVAIVGSGANALAFAAHAKNLGAEPVCIGSESRRESFSAVGVPAYYNYKDDALVEKMHRDGNCEFDYLIDGVGDAPTDNLLLPMLRRDGTVGVYGWNDRSSCGVNPFCSAHSFRIYNDAYDEEETSGAVFALIQRGRLHAENWYDMRNPIPLDKIAPAYESLRRHEALKYLIELNPAN